MNLVAMRHNSTLYTLGNHIEDGIQRHKTILINPFQWFCHFVCSSVKKLT